MAFGAAHNAQFYRWRKEKSDRSDDISGGVPSRPQLIAVIPKNGGCQMSSPKAPYLVWARGVAPVHRAVT